MKIFLGLLLLAGVSALADQTPEGEPGNPVVIQDGQPAQAYVETALSRYLDKPPYFYAKRLTGKNVLVAFVDFYCGLSEKERLHCVTFLAFDPQTSEHWFMTPERLAQASNESAI